MKLLSVVVTLCVFGNLQGLFADPLPDSCSPQLEKCQEDVTELTWNVTELLAQLEEAKEKIQLGLDSLEMCRNPFGEITEDIYEMTNIVVPKEDEKEDEGELRDLVDLLKSSADSFLDLKR
jgi:hypothetical protein